MASTTDAGMGLQVLAIDASTGALAPTEQGLVPTEPLPGRIVFSPDGRRLYVPTSDPYREIDGIEGFRLDGGTGRLTRLEGMPIHAPYQSLHHVQAMTPDGTFLLIGVGQFTSRSVAVYRLDADGKASPVAGSPFPVWPGPEPFPVFDIVIDPSGDMAVVANYWGALAAVRIDRATGALTPLPGSFRLLPNQPGRLALLP
jgi:DNA-binding beta-propeller fold protein YncE